MSWGNTCTSKLTKIRTKENKCIRNIFFANWRKNASPYYKLPGILKLDNVFKMRIATICYIIAHEKKDVPSIFLNFITLAAESMHSYNTRFASNLNFSRPTVRTNYGIYIASTLCNMMQYIASKLWEQIPQPNPTLTITLTLTLKQFINLKKNISYFFVNGKIL